MTAVAHYTESLYIPHSSNLDAAYYNDNEQTLIIEFLSGSLIGYRDVPWHIFNGLKETVARRESAGKYYNATIKGKYHGLGVDITSLSKVDRNPEDNLVSVGQTQNFVITGYVRFSEPIKAATIEEAVKKFIEKHNGATVTEATVKFI